VSNTPRVNIDYYQFSTMLLICGHVSCNVVPCDLSHVQTEQAEMKCLVPYQHKLLDYVAVFMMNDDS
jgi:hypothetical protein